MITLRLNHTRINKIVIPVSSQIVPFSGIGSDFQHFRRIFARLKAFSVHMSSRMNASSKNTPLNYK